MSRSLKKGPYVDPKLYAKVVKQREGGGAQPITTWARACTIVPEFVGATFIHAPGMRGGKNIFSATVASDHHRSICGLPHPPGRCRSEPHGSV